MLLHNKFKKYRFSILSRISFVMIGVFLMFCVLFGYAISYFHSNMEIYEKKIINENISLILKTHERFRLNSKFKTIADTIWQLEAVDAVVLFNKSCNSIVSIPLNLNYENCKVIDKKSSWQYRKYNDQYSELGLIAVKINSQFKTRAIANVLPVTFVILFFTIVGILLALIYIQRYLKKPLKIMAQNISYMLEDKYSSKFVNWPYPSELKPVFNALFKTQNDLKEMQKNIIAQAEIETTKKIHEQVAHNIRSPLAALDTLMSNIHCLPEIERNHVRHAVNRIHDIANKLVQNNNSINSGLNTYLLSELVASIIAEKRVEFQNFSNISIIHNKSNEEYGLFVNVDQIEFKNIISNTINNSKDAFANRENGKVEISITNPIQSEIKIEILDNGQGISSELLPELFKKGSTFGKASGKGEGLYHAKTNLEKWDGNIKIESEVNKYTRLEITLPKAHQPKWYLPCLKINSSGKVVIADDDSSVHQMWKKRFIDMNINLIHLYSPQELINWNEKNSDKKIQYLIDYQFLNDKLNGLDLISKLKIEDKSVLVTSRHDDSEIQEKCISASVKLLPKQIVQLIPIEVLSDNEKTLSNVSAVLIDDDELVRMDWEINAKNKGIKFMAFNNSGEFIKLAPKLNKDVHVYIDSNLGEDLSGEQIAKQINEMGIDNIYLTTGFEKGRFGNLPWVKEIVGKKTPW